jgi:hypothetical protein
MSFIKHKALLVVTLMWSCVGCVNVQDNVQIQRTTSTNAAQDVAQKCDLKPYVARIILAMGSASLQGVGLVRDKATFETTWNVLTVDPTQVYTKIEGTNEPQVDWTNQQVYFLQIGRLDNTCTKVVPVKVETDCMSVFITLSKIQYVNNCQPGDSYPVFVYVLPRTDLPFEVHWTEDADGDGFSNDSEIKAGTDPLDPKSHP